MKIYEAAKLLLTNGWIKPPMAHNNTILGKCPACKLYHDEKFKYSYYTGHILICPNIGVKIYGIYG